MPRLGPVGARGPAAGRRHVDRTAQFMPFAALTGYGDLLCERAELAERAYANDTVYPSASEALNDPFACGALTHDAFACGATQKGGPEDPDPLGSTWDADAWEAP